MSGLLDESVPLAISAQNLLDSAKVLQHNQTFDTLHIVLAALSPGEADIPISKVLAALVDDEKRIMWIGGIHTMIRINHTPPTSVDTMTNRLQACAQAWQQEAKDRKVYLTDAVILWTIIAKDPISRELMEANEINLDIIMSGLENKFEPRSQVQPPPGQIAESLPTKEDEEARKEAVELTTKVQPEPEHCHRDMHSVQMANFLNVLGNSAVSDKHEIVVLVGPHGSPIHDLDKVLAYRLASDEHFIGQREPLNKYSAVHQLDLEAISTKAHIQHKPPPACILEPTPSRVLEMAKRQALGNKAILMLTHIELFRRHGLIEDDLRTALANRGETLIFGVYIFDENNPPGQNLALGLPNIRQVPVRRFDAAETREFIQKYHSARWAALGYQFTSDAFDSIMELEPGAWIEERRKGLPHLAVGLGNDSIMTAEEGDESIINTAQRALKALEKLFSEERSHPSVTDHTRIQFEKTLQQAEEDITDLIANPSPEVSDAGKRILTRRHIVAQLICPNESEFHYPPLEPVQAHGSSKSARRSSRTSPKNARG